MGKLRADSESRASQSVSVAASPPRGSALGRSSAPPMRPPIGLRNFLKSSCYLNSVLQCLTFTPPLAEYCFRPQHSTSCTRCSTSGDCTFCILELRIRKSLKFQGGVDAPRKLYSKMMSNSDYFEPGRQEDAHELLRYLIDDCGKTFESDNQVPRPGSPNDPKTVLDNIFGGVLQSLIECRQCGAGSAKHDEMLDLNLEICHWSCLDRTVACFFRPEVLDGDNKYRCRSCNRLSVARKRMSIFRAPKVLTIHLKRFDPLSGSKLNHHIQFEERLSIADYLSKKFTGPVPEHTLYGVIVHRGLSLSHGHYYAYVKDTNGKWYLCDDENVSEVSVEQVLADNAYLLFYNRDDPTTSHSE